MNFLGSRAMRLAFYFANFTVLLKAENEGAGAPLYVRVHSAKSATSTGRPVDTRVSKRADRCER
jgi:hypothetical protein